MDESNKLLFAAQVDAPVYGAYSAAFLSDIDKKNLAPLTFFPEDITWLGATGEIQLQNRFGVFRGKDKVGQLSVLKGFTNFLDGGEIRTGKLGPVQTSPDGKYLTFLRETSPAFGDLILLDVAQAKETVISTQVELDLQDLQLLWAPDSRVLVYEKNNRLYYYSVEQLLAGRMLGEELRIIGPGQISSVRWGRYNQLVYINGSLVYEILAAEMFTRSLYQDFLKIGRIIGTIPQQFDPVFDRFWLAPEGDKVILEKNGNSLFLFLLKGYSEQNTAVLQLPYLLLPGNMRISAVVWDDRDQIILLARNKIAGNEASQVFRLNAKAGQNEYHFEKLDAPLVRNLQESPDGQIIALLTSDGIQIRSGSDWKLQQSLVHPDPLHLVFVADNSMIVAGKWYGERLTLGKKASDPVRREFLFFSQADDMGFDSKTGQISLKSKDRAMILDGDRMTWVAQAAFQVRKAKTASSANRVYLEQLYSGPYANMVMVRKVKEPGTSQLFQPPQTVFEDFPQAVAGEKLDLQNFQHGERQRKREIALTFNAIDSVDGLERILDTLTSYHVKATFFLNGEFIRRYPWAAKEIADAGQEVGSLFYMYFNMSDPRYQIDADFIRQGLSRNEQDYYDATGKELSLLWRTPYYLVNEMILNAGSELKYTLVGRDVDSLDNITKGQTTASVSLYQPASNIIEQILKQKKPGSIVAMTVGRPGFDENSALERDDYLFDKLDILINNLLQKGYVPVPVSSLIEAAR